jgi:hypothetical protein
MTQTDARREDRRDPQAARAQAGDRPSAAFLALARMPARALERMLVRGQAPDLVSLAGWAFRGLNTPPWARLLGIRKFIKGFDAPAGLQAQGAPLRELRGYNCAVVQNAVDEPWIGRPDPARPERFGYYRVGAVEPSARDNAYLHAVLLDYGRGGNARLDPARGLRDYLVQVDPERPDLFLGKAYYALGPARLGVSFFVLERHRPVPEMGPTRGTRPRMGSTFPGPA